jgi:alpha-tubulin suppressor-like RCC1 family protein
MVETALARVDVGPGALAASTAITVVAAHETASHSIVGLAGDELRSLAAIVNLGPSGTTFAQPVFVTLTLPTPLNPVHPFLVLVFDVSAGVWSPAHLADGNVITARVSADGTSARFPVDHFSSYAVSSDTSLFTRADIGGPLLVVPSFIVEQSVLADALAPTVLRLEQFRREAYARLLFRMATRDGLGISAQEKALADTLKGWNDAFQVWEPGAGFVKEVRDYYRYTSTQLSEYATGFRAVIEVDGNLVEIDNSLLAMGSGFASAYAEAAQVVDAVPDLVECFAETSFYDTAAYAFALERLDRMNRSALNTPLWESDLAYRSAFALARERIAEEISNRASAWSEQTLYDFALGGDACVDGSFKAAGWLLSRLGATAKLGWTGGWAVAGDFLLSVLQQDVLGAGREAVEMSIAGTVYFYGGVLQTEPLDVIGQLPSPIHFTRYAEREAWLGQQVSAWEQFALCDGISKYLDASDTTWYNKVLLMTGGIGTGFGYFDRALLSQTFKGRSGEYAILEAGIASGWEGPCTGVETAACRNELNFCPGWCGAHSWQCGTNPCGQSCGNCSGRTTCDSSHQCSSVTTWVSAAAGRYHTVAIRSDGTLWAWGFNPFGQIGNGSTVSQSVPVQVDTGFASVAAGGVHTAAVKFDGTLWAWGGNFSGQLGIGTTTSQHAPVQVGTGFTTVAAGSEHTMAVKADGTLWAWGGNSYGQLGNGTTVDQTSPAQVGVGFAFVAAGGTHTVAVKSDGTLWAWGGNIYGQLGTGTTTDQTSPTLIGSGFASIAAGFGHTVAVKLDGTLWAWGYNGLGELGDGTTMNQTSPVRVGTGFASVAVGDYHTVGVKTDGTIWAWGYNGTGELGDGTHSDRALPVQIGAGYASSAAGASHTLGLRADGTLWAWGNNGQGQLGIGASTPQASPVQIPWP